MIILKEITNKNVWDVCKLKVKKDQENFVAWNIESLAEAYATRNEGNNALPLAVYDNEQLIGFVMIGKGTIGEEEESDTIKNNYCLAVKTLTRISKFHNVQLEILEDVQKAWTSSFRIDTIKRLEKLLFLNWRSV